MTTYEYDTTLVDYLLGKEFAVGSIIINGGNFYTEGMATLSFKPEMEFEETDVIGNKEKTIVINTKRGVSGTITMLIKKDDTLKRLVERCMEGPTNYVVAFTDATSEYTIITTNTMGGKIELDSVEAAGDNLVEITLNFTASAESFTIEPKP